MNLLPFARYSSSAVVTPACSISVSIRQTGKLVGKPLYLIENVSVPIEGNPNDAITKVCSILQCNTTREIAFVTNLLRLNMHFTNFELRKTGFFSTYELRILGNPSLLRTQKINEELKLVPFSKNDPDPEKHLNIIVSSFFQSYFNYFRMFNNEGNLEFSKRAPKERHLEDFHSRDESCKTVPEIDLD